MAMLSLVSHEHLKFFSRCGPQNWLDFVKRKGGESGREKGEWERQEINGKRRGGKENGTKGVGGRE